MGCSKRSLRSAREIGPCAIRRKLGCPDRHDLGIYTPLHKTGRDRASGDTEAESTPGKADDIYAGGGRRAVRRLGS